MWLAVRIIFLKNWRRCKDPRNDNDVQTRLPDGFSRTYKCKDLSNTNIEKILSPTFPKSFTKVNRRLAGSARGNNSWRIFRRSSIESWGQWRSKGDKGDMIYMYIYIYVCHIYIHNNAFRYTHLRVFSRLLPLLSRSWLKMIVPGFEASRSLKSFPSLLWAVRSLFVSQRPGFSTPLWNLWAKSVSSSEFRDKLRTERIGKD